MPPRPPWTRGRPNTPPPPAIPELKAAIADKFNRENGLPYKPEQITTGAGGKHCLYMAFMAVLNPGDEVIIPAPYWVSYPEQVKLAGGVLKFSSATNPTASTSPPGSLQAAITPKTTRVHHQLPQQPRRPRLLARRTQGPGRCRRPASATSFVFSDEIYEKLVYDGQKFVSFATLHPELLDRTLTFNCHSKTFAMTGWRIGYIGGPKPIIDAINKLQSQMTSHITSFCAASMYHPV